MSDVANQAVRVERYARRHNLTLTVADWLLRQAELSDAEDAAVSRFLEPRLAHLTPPANMLDRDAAAARLARAVRNRERVCVFGDYDCDGMTAAAILTDMLRKLGGSVEARLANRFDGGYGVSAPAVEHILATRPSLLVTCDCGSSDHESLRRIREAGVEVVVIDHHLVPDEPLPALAFLNPHRPECGFPYKGLASCGLVLSLGAALRQELGVDLDLRQWLDLVAIGTIADVAPLDGDNRALVRAGLALLTRPVRPGLLALSELARFDGLTPLTARDVAFKIAPRLNAPGRLGAPDVVLDLLLAKDDVVARGLAAEVEQLSLERRRIQNEMVEACIEQIEAEQLQRAPAIVIGRQGWNHGIVGIVAGRVADRYALPSVIIGFDGEVGRGSVRGPAGSRLHDALVESRAHLRRFGGHQAAAGLEIAEAELEGFRRLFCDSIERMPARVDTGQAADVIELCAGDSPARVVADLQRLEPCGEKNPRPKLAVEAVLEQVRQVRGGHLKLLLVVAGQHKISGFAVGQAELATTLERGARVVVVGDLRRDTWAGGEAVELLIERVSAAAPAFATRADTPPGDTASGDAARGSATGLDAEPRAGNTMDQPIP